MGRAVRPALGLEEVLHPPNLVPAHVVAMSFDLCSGHLPQLSLQHLVDHLGADVYGEEDAMVSSGGQRTGWTLKVMVPVHFWIAASGAHWATHSASAQVWANYRFCL